MKPAQLLQKIQSSVSSNSSTLWEPNELSTYLNSTEGFSRTLLCVVKIGVKSDIQKLLVLADSLYIEDNISLKFHPVSTGKNWGYGSGLPTTTNAHIVVLDLSLLNKITYFDQENGICSIEPGVTQAILFEFLKSKGADFMVPVTGAGPDCSIFSNALERGYGITPIADHFAAVTNIKGYLANGEKYESSLAAMDGSKGQYVDKTFKWKLGPYLDGLLTQSGNIVATDMTIVLARRPTYIDSFYISFYKTDSFAQAYICMKEIFKSLPGIVGSINIMDQRRIMAMVAENPQGKNNHLNVTNKQLAAIAKQHDIPEWTLVGTLYTDEKIARAAKKIITGIVDKSSSKIIFASNSSIKIARYITNIFDIAPLTNIRKKISTLDAGMQIMRGIPNRVALPLAYWRTEKSTTDIDVKLNPAEDDCGLLWYAPLVPSKLENMLEFITMVRKICSVHNIEPMITFTNLSHFSTDSTIPIVFNKKDPKATKEALECLHKLMTIGCSKGFIPYRLNIEQQLTLNGNHVYWKTAHAIKKALDPQDKISPERYNPTRGHRTLQ